VNWILIIATVCYPTTINTQVSLTQGLAYAVSLPPRPTIEAKTFKSRADLEAFVLARVQWGPCSERLMGLAPDGTPWSVERVERKRKVVREVEESDGFAVEWREVIP
jgi:hypothetical protein